MNAFEWTENGGTGNAPDFSLTVTPVEATVARDGSASFTVTVAAANGFGETVSLSASRFGTNASGSFNPPSIKRSGTSTLTVTTTGTAQTSQFNLMITASSRVLSHSANAAFNVNSSKGTSR